MFQQAIVLSSDTTTDAYAPHSTRVAGLTMLKRTLVMLQWAGVEETLVVNGPWDADASRHSLESDRELDPSRMRIRWLTDADATKRGGLAIAPAARHIRGTFAVLRADTVLDKGIVTALAARRVESGRALLATDGDQSTGLVLCDRAVAAMFNGHTVSDALAAFEKDGRLGRFDVGGRFWQRVTDADSARRAEDLLWNSCRKPIDGVVSRNINRHISLFVSRRIAHLGIRPNHVSVFNLVLGILAAVSFYQGSYWWMVLGTVFFNLNSILDGVDGELARVKYQMSVVGEWFDTIADDASNLMFFVTVALGAHRVTGDDTWLTLGLLTVVPSLLATAYQYTVLIRSGRGDLLAIRWLFERGNGKGEGERTLLGRVLDKAKYLVKKDFFVLLTLVVALFGLLPWMLYLTVVANLIVFATVIGQEVAIHRLRRAGQAVERVVTGTPAAAAPAGPPRVGRRPAPAAPTR